ncbi:polysaccharide pyruvyl transferase family protein [Haloferax prahovense]|uniref:polysaccharide pyruvyl transferase family protein n=1 Tax=Haloferax prahovense TaxID=381852 RepID=UPI0015F2CD84|nr:polysaccharide pyruvyl transferase family protein [Haloferax prahovense]
MRILLLRTWLTNIGNGFIDKGAKALLEQAAPDSTIIEVSGYPNISAERKAKGEIGNISNVLGVPQIRNGSPDIQDRMVNIADFVDADVAVLPGCILYEFALDAYHDLLKRLNRRNIPIIFLGAGGGNYEVGTQRYVRKVIDSLHSPAIITRDQTAYDCYSSEFEHSFSGIDCAFYISDWYEPPTSTNNFVISAFDRAEETNFTTELPVIRPHHNPFMKPHEGAVKNLIWGQKNQEYFESENIFMSDTLEDYLFLYANTDVTYSDRIHSCVPTLAYGNKAMFDFKTPRAKLFDQILEEDITEGPVRLPEQVLQDKKEKQINQVKDILREVVG